jgi:hypothetical protein
VYETDEDTAAVGGIAGSADVARVLEAVEDDGDAAGLRSDGVQRSAYSE